MVSIKSLLAIAFVACCLVQLYDAQTCTASSSITTCTIPVTFYDQAPAWMAHGRWPAQWWNVNAFYDYPANGSCGTANNTFGFSNSDFELPLHVLQNLQCCSSSQYNAPIINGEKGLVGRLCTAADGSDTGCGVIGADRTPQYIYPGRSQTGQVSSPASFYTFFHNVEQTYQVPYNLTLTQDPVHTSVRSYTNFKFFPLDGLGWNDYSQNFVNGKLERHNYAFCMVMNTHFTYSGGEYFFFEGDDDVYAYINGYLIMDLGGVHTALNASLYTDNLKLTKSVTYRFDFFYCERHTTSSDIAFSTTINFFCAYTDWCGVCDGDGQSCCSDLCDDGNPCTTDACSVFIAPPSGCNHTAVVCPPSTSCLNSFCDPNSGNCVTTPVNCNDNNACTVDTCGPGGCSNTPRTDCGSNNACNITGCNPSTGCTSAPRSCTTSNLCQSASCSSSVGCVTTPIPCTTSNLCQTATCTPSQGCQITNNAPCNDNNVCTTDTCDPTKGCVYTPKNISTCGVSTRCIQWSCDPVRGCQSSSTTCTAPDACHTAYCDPNAGCQYLAKSCTGDACGTSACNPSTGACVYTPNPPCASRSCYNATCNPSTGCQYTAATCTPTQPCTVGTCNNNQCTFTTTLGVGNCGNCTATLSCSAADQCNPQSCINQTCVTIPKNCNDYNPCTVDTCVNNNCVHTPIVCSAGDSCHPQTCSATTGQCVFLNNVTCNDNNACTNDACVPTSSSAYTCSNVPIMCNSSDPFCHPVECQNGVCVNTSLPDCTDGNPCTFDICSNGACSNPLVCPDSGTLCNPIVCLNGSCITRPVNCSSGNLCSIDSCDPTTGQCLHSAKNCGGTTCNPSSCNLTTGQCEVPTLLECNDGNPCTLDTRLCDPTYGFSCNNSDQSYLCNSNSACILDFCNSTSVTASNTTEACYHKNVTCTAPTICQVVAGCDARNGCFYAPRICPTPADWCQVAVCDEIAGCLNVARACAPEDNYCFAGFCNNATRTCSQQQRPNWQTITNQAGVTCLLAYNTAAKAGLTAGIIAAIVIAAVVAAALIAIAGKKGVDVFLASRAAPIGGASTNPLYVESAGQGQNALYKGR